MSFHTTGVAGSQPAVQVAARVLGKEGTGALRQAGGHGVHRIELSLLGGHITSYSSAPNYNFHSTALFWGLNGFLWANYHLSC